MVRFQERAKNFLFSEMSRILPEPTQWELEAIFPGLNRQVLSTKLKNAWSPNFTPPYTSMSITGRTVPLPFTVFPYLPHALISRVFPIHSHGKLSFFFYRVKPLYMYNIFAVCQKYA
jgi:hypothetical protein